MKLPHTILKGESTTMSEKIIQLNEGAIKGELRELVRSSVEETLNGLL
jgi:putative transposase